MLGKYTTLVKVAGLALVVSSAVGCGGSEKAIVPISYTLKPTKGLPPGLQTVAVLPAERGPATDEKWSDMTVSIIQHLIQQANDKYGYNLQVADRTETKKVFAESDMVAAGMTPTSGTLGAPAKVLGVQAFILSKINVKVEKHKGKKRTVDGMSMAAWAGRHWGGGSGSVSTTEVETVTRNMTVQTEFKLTDAKTSKNWATWAPKPYRATEKTKASPFFGSSKTEAELTPRDQIIGTLVERGARDFCSQFIPCEVEYEVEVKSSGNEACQQGVKLLRGDMYAEALAQFRTAITEDPQDHRALFAAGVSCEKLRKCDEALNFYKKAFMQEPEAEYAEAKKRMAENMDRIRAEG